MADTLKVLGQAAPSAATETDLYTVPARTMTTVSSLLVCNRDGSAHVFRIAVRPKGAAISNEHYLYYGTSLAANAAMAIIVGMTLSEADVVTVYDADGNLSFTLFGVETT